MRNTRLYLELARRSWCPARNKHGSIRWLSLNSDFRNEMLWRHHTSFTLLTTVIAICMTWMSSDGTAVDFDRFMRYKTAFGILTSTEQQQDISGHGMILYSINFMEYSSTLNANSCSAIHEILCSLWYPKLHYRVHILILSSHLCLGLLSVLFRLGFPTKILYICHLCHVCYMSRPSHPPWFDHPNNKEWR